MHTFCLALLLGLLVSDVSTSTFGLNSSSAYYGNLSSKAVNTSNVNHDSLAFKSENSSSNAFKAENRTFDAVVFSPITFDPIPGGGYRLRMLEPLANRTAPSLNAQKCSDPNGLGLKKRGAPVCDGTDCVIVNGIMALIAANAMVEYAGYWMYVSNIPPENMPNDLEPGWMEMENYALVNELFPALDPSDAKQMAILTNISKFFFGLASKLHREPDAVPTVVTVTWSEITCSSQPTSSIAVTSTRSCPKISATFTSPVTTVSTFNPPCGTTLCSRAATNTQLAFTVPVCEEESEWAGCSCLPTSPDSAMDYLDDIALDQVLFSELETVFKEMNLPPQCVTGLHTTMSTTETVCSCGSMIYLTKTGPSESACAYESSSDLPTPLPTNCAVSFVTTTFPSTNYVLATPSVTQVTSTMSSCACDASRTVSATSWLLASSTTTACLTGQTIPTPTITAVSHPNPQYFRSAEWELTFYAGTTCAANQFPFPSTGANALWGTTTYPCQNLQQASSYGTYVSASIAPSATDCIQLFTDPNCQSSQPTVLCGEGTCCGDSWGGLYPFGNADWSPFFVQSWMVVPQGSSPDASWCNS